MKKYIIKYADGREQHHMKAEHNSRKEAGETLMNYNHSRKPVNGSYLSPFDFKLEEVECTEVNELITDFESAKKALGYISPADFILSINNSNLEDAARLVSDINPKHIEALIALNKLFTIAEAWNKEDGFVPDFSDWEQDKWFPWIKYDKDAARFVYATTTNSPTHGDASFGSRLCFKTAKRAAQFGKQFGDLYNKVFL